MLVFDENGQKTNSELKYSVDFGRNRTRATLEDLECSRCLGQPCFQGSLFWSLAKIPNLCHLIRNSISLKRSSQLGIVDLQWMQAISLWYCLFLERLFPVINGNHDNPHELRVAPPIPRATSLISANQRGLAYQSQSNWSLLSRTWISI